MSNLLLCLKDNQGNISLVADYGDIAMIVVPESNCIMKNGHTIHFANKEVAQALANEFWQKVGEKPGKESVENFGTKDNALDEEIDWNKLLSRSKGRTNNAFLGLMNNPEFITNRNLRDRFKVIGECRGIGAKGLNMIREYLAEKGIEV